MACPSYRHIDCFQFLLLLRQWLLGRLDISLRNLVADVKEQFIVGAAVSGNNSSQVR